MERPTRTNLILLLVITLGLVSLGIKLPNLQELASSSSKPKPRPRAVIKTQTKSCQESNKKIQADLSSDTPVRNALPTVSDAVAPYGFRISLTPPVELVISNNLSRAPPSLS